MKRTSNILTITGSDGTGFSGVQADIRNIASLGGHAVTAVTSITVQTTLGIQQYHDIPAEVVGSQIEAAFDDAQPNIIKIGMVRTVPQLLRIVEALNNYHPQHVIYAPVVYSTSGERLMSPSLTEHIRELLLPLCTTIIMRGNDTEFLPSDISTHIFLLDEKQMHGTVNTFASTFAFYLTQTDNLEEAERLARLYVSRLAMPEPTTVSRTDELYNRFLNDIETFHQQSADVSFYAERLGISTRYLSQLTRRMAGTTPKAVISEYLTKAIVKCLQTSDAPLKQIAADFGFTSDAHFSRFVKKQTGKVPSAMKRHT